MKKSTVTMATSTLALGLLAGLPASAHSTAAAAAATAAAGPNALCSSWVDFEIDGRWGRRLVEDSKKLTFDGHRSQQVGYTRVAAALVGESGADGMHQSDHLVVSTDGKLRAVRQKHIHGEKSFTLTTRSIVRDDFRPYRFGGQFGSFFSISKKGTVHLHEQLPPYDKVRLAEPRKLPVALPDAGGVAVWRMDDKVVIYSNNRRTGTLRQVIMDEGKPETAEGHVIAWSGWNTPTHLFAGPCRATDDGRVANRISLLAINKNSGNGSFRQHYKPLSHGKTLIHPVQVGKGSWKLEGLGQ